MAIRVGSRVISFFYETYKKRGTVQTPLQQPKGWGSKFAWIKWDDGTYGSEMKCYLKREDELIPCPKCKKEHAGFIASTGTEGGMLEYQYVCTDCKHTWWKPAHMVKKN